MSATSATAASWPPHPPDAPGCRVPSGPPDLTRADFVPGTFPPEPVTLGGPFFTGDQPGPPAPDTFAAGSGAGSPAGPDPTPPEGTRRPTGTDESTGTGPAATGKLPGLTGRLAALGATTLRIGLAPGRLCRRIAGRSGRARCGLFVMLGLIALTLTASAALVVAGVSFLGGPSRQTAPIVAGNQSDPVVVPGAGQPGSGSARGARNNAPHPTPSNGNRSLPLPPVPGVECQVSPTGYSCEVGPGGAGVNPGTGSRPGMRPRVTPPSHYPWPFH